MTHYYMPLANESPAPGEDALPLPIYGVNLEGEILFFFHISPLIHLRSFHLLHIHTVVR